MGDDLEPGEQEQCDERRRLPDVDGADGRKRGARVGDPGMGLGQDVESHARVADDAVRLEHRLPHLRRDDGRNRPRDEHHRAHDAAALEARVDDEGDREPEHELERDRDDRELERRPDGIPEDRVVPEVLVVLEPDPAHRVEREELLVGEALEDGLAERVEGDDGDDREGGDEQRPGEPGLPALELRRLAPASGSGYWGRDGRHRDGGGGWQMPPSPATDTAVSEGSG